ncbi:MAG TPA: hypothetical protein PLX18_11420 [Anaerohalosphaeraceae bacterium]|nr:hypothetical protein [Anaerohalosphaeraceae bacterium]HQG06856.1 hypothetical protein [Anaerohalosphaeraceae bacterium]HQI08451.1 hypothetical protein [Anaerohalosphaeraceae bacterium]HQJ68770.1 hypothetical protein [Anaerohalosphaeraceae bacterium]
MAQITYTMNFTETSRRIAESLRREGFSYRQILNAGIILFDQADMTRRGEAILLAEDLMKEELKSLILRLQDRLAWMKKIRNPNAFSEDEKKLAAFLESFLDQNPSGSAPQVTIALLSPEEQKALEAFRRTVAPESHARTKRKAAP